MNSRQYLTLVILVALMVLLPFVATPAIAQDNSIATPVLNILTDGTTVTLYWVSIEGAARYELWQWDDVNKWVRLDDGNLTDTSFTQRDLQARQRYWYTIRAIGSFGQESDYSAYVSTTIESGIATPVMTALALEPYDGFGFSLRYEHGLIIWVSEGSPAAKAGLKKDDVVLFVNDTSTEGLTLKEYHDLTSGPVVDLVVSREGVQDPLTITITRGRVVPNAIYLSWFPTDVEVRYEIWKWQEYVGWELLLGNQEYHDNGNMFYDYGVEREVKYYYTIRAVDAEGNTSQWAAYVWAEVGKQP